MFKMIEDFDGSFPQNFYSRLSFKQLECCIVFHSHWTLLVSAKFILLSMDLIKLIEYAHIIYLAPWWPAMALQKKKNMETRKCSSHVHKRDGMCALCSSKQAQAQFGAFVSSIARLFCFVLFY